MEVLGFKEIEPKSYLNDGFLTPDGQIREGINGYYSLSVAYQCRDEGVEPENIKRILEKIDEWFSKDTSPDADQELAPEVRTALQKLQNLEEVRSSTTLKALVEASLPHLGTWREMAAFILHLERILAQLALLTVKHPENPA